MRCRTGAAELARVLDLVTALVQPAVAARIPVLGAVRLTAADGAVSVTLCNGYAQVTLSVPAEVTEAGEVAVPADKLAGLTAAFDTDAMIEIATDRTMVMISSGRSHFKLPTLPVADLSTLTLANETHRATISRADAAALFARPGFAIPQGDTRYYLNGIFLHDLAGCLTAVATDGYRLVRVTVDAAGWSQDSRCIVPASAMKVITKLIRANRDAEEITLRRSAGLVEVEAPDRFRLTSKLIDGTYPDYQGPIGRGGGGCNVVAVDPTDLTGALARIAAVTESDAVVGLAWGPEHDDLQLCAIDHGDAALDVVAVRDRRGAARIAFKTSHGLDLLGALDGENVTIDAGSTPGVPILITDGTAGFLAVQMPVLRPEGDQHQRPPQRRDPARRRGSRDRANTTRRRHNVDMTKFGGPHFNTIADVQPGPAQKVNASVRKGKFDKPDLHFTDGTALSLNADRRQALIQAWGPDSDDWIGKVVELSLGTVEFNGKELESVVVRPISPPLTEAEKIEKAVKAVTAAKAAKPASDDLDDEIPFR